jgi:hypothetical protein
MQRIKPDVDIILDILKAVLEAHPASSFTQSLLQQYQERGGLSKKQLQGLHGKASKIESIPAGKLATLEAIILKKPSRYKSSLPVETNEPPVRDEATGIMLDAILARFPAHKRALYFKSKYDNDETLSSTELSELKKFHSLAVSR